jgi:hypothetical protein
MPCQQCPSGVRKTAIQHSYSGFMANLPLQLNVA